MLRVVRIDGRLINERFLTFQLSESPKELEHFFVSFSCLSVVLFQRVGRGRRCNCVLIARSAYGR